MCTVTNAAEHQEAMLGVWEALVQISIHLSSCFTLPYSGHWTAISTGLHCPKPQNLSPETPQYVLVA